MLIVHYTFLDTTDHVFYSQKHRTIKPKYAVKPLFAFLLVENFINLNDFFRLDHIYEILK